MASLFNQAKGVASTFLKDLTGLQDMEKDDLVQILDICINNHKTLITAYKKLSPKDLEKWSSKLFAILQGQSSKSAAVWSKYTKSLQPKPMAMESKKLFSSVIFAAEKLQSTLSDIKKNIDTIFDTPSEKISTLTFRKSHIAVFGAIASSLYLSGWSEYMFMYLASLLDGTESDIPKYREVYLEQHLDKVIDIVNTETKSDTTTFVKEVQLSRTKTLDTPLFSNGISTTKGLDPISTALTISFYLVIALLSLRVIFAFIRWAPEKLGLWAHEQYLRNVEMKEWLTTRIAKLKLDLEDMNPNDPQYQKLMKAIEVYDEKIRDLDKKIDAYLNG